jgi:hypothetical protein
MPSPLPPESFALRAFVGLHEASAALEETMGPGQLGS